jgi:hypothetical protein
LDRLAQEKREESAMSSLSERKRKSEDYQGKNKLENSNLNIW